MILEVAVLQVLPEKLTQFEQAFTQAQEIISAMQGYQWHQLQKCLEVPNQYLLLVGWDTLADHTVGFRQSSQYQEWKKLLHHFYDPFPTVEHYQLVTEKRSGT